MTGKHTRHQGLRAARYLTSGWSFVRLMSLVLVCLLPFSVVSAACRNIAVTIVASIVRGWCIMRNSHSARSLGQSGVPIASALSGSKAITDYAIKKIE